MNKRIAVIAPDKTVRFVPMEQAHEAVAHGGALAMRMFSPMGKPHWVPLQMVHHAVNAGGTLTSPLPAESAQQVEPQGSADEPQSAPAPGSGNEGSQADPETDGGKEGADHVPIVNVLDAAMQLGSKWGASRVSAAR